jgi:hypothetical protein
MAKWPFFLADGVLVAAAALILWLPSSPPSPVGVAVAVLLLLAGAGISLVPYGIESYWSWQHLEAERREGWEAQQQAMGKLGAEIKVWLSRCQTVNAGPPPTGGDTVSEGESLEELARALGQWEARLEQREATFAAELERYGQAENERREEFRQYLDHRLTQLAEFLDGSERADLVSGDGAGEEAAQEPVEEPVEEFFEADAEPQSDSHWAADPGDPPAAAPRKRKISAPRTQFMDESSSSLFATTTLVATAFIGPSNKLYLRGEGPGLSWSEGVPMNFVEIGKWSWTTTEASGPIRVQILKNDEEQDRSGILVVAPGSTVSLRPDFD